MKIISDLVTHVESLIASGEKLLSELGKHQSVTQAQIHAPEAAKIQDLHAAAKATVEEAKADLERRDNQPPEVPPTFQERVIAEKSELDAKLSKLQGFLKSVVFSTLDQLEQNRLSEQADIMDAYSIVLGQRIDAFSAPAPVISDEPPAAQNGPGLTAADFPDGVMPSVPAPVAPPADNEHVAEGCERFPDVTIEHPIEVETTAPIVPAQEPTSH